MKLAFLINTGVVVVLTLMSNEALAHETNQEEPVSAQTEQEHWRATPPPAPGPPPPPEIPVEWERKPFHRRPARKPSSGKVPLTMGWILFGVPYFGSCMAGAILVIKGVEQAGYLFIPVAGPIVEAGLIGGSTSGGDDFSSSLSNAAAFWTAMVGVSQALGLILAAVGHSKRKKYRSRTRILSRISVAPAGPKGTSGLSLAAQF